MSAQAPEVHLAIGSRFENIELVKVVVDDFLRQLGMDEDGRHWIEIAVREAVANAIKHGNRQDPAKRVEVDLELAADDLRISVVDQGSGFDPAAVKDPLAPENRFQRDGRGIFYMRSFMDAIDFNFPPGGGTRVVLHKRMSRPQAGAKTKQEERS
jgi:serine/threonine-protein kinase RsbW